MAKLTALKARHLVEPGRYSDGDGLYLLVGPGGAKSWILRVHVDGRRRDLGLGSFKLLSLLGARDAALELRRKLRGISDPYAPAPRAPKPARARTLSFGEAAAKVHGERTEGWKNGKHQAQWIKTLENYVFPTLGDLAVDEIGAGPIHDAVAPIWLSKPETARRVLQRIGVVLDWACAKGLRENGSPTKAVIKGLPRQPRKTGHFEALGHGEVPAFLTALRAGKQSPGRLALELLILTATRSGEVRGARWGEFDLARRIWTVPAERMKAGTAHVVPLSDAALDVLRRAEVLRMPCTDLVFPGQRPKAPLSDMTLLKVIRDMGAPATVHGFRSSFRDWVAEETAFPGEVAEAALAHTVPSKVEAAYKRTDFLAKRGELMTAWARYCGSKPKPMDGVSRQTHDRASAG